MRKLHYLDMKRRRETDVNHEQNVDQALDWRTDVFRGRMTLKLLFALRENGNPTNTSAAYLERRMFECATNKQEYLMFTTISCP